MVSKFKPNTKFFVIICILVFTVFTGTLVYANVASSTPETNNQSSESTAPNSGSTIDVSDKTTEENQDTISYKSADDTYKSKGTSEKSPNGEITAVVVRKNGVKFDTIIFKGKDNNAQTIDLVNILYTGIERTAWIDDTRYTIYGHINPSLQVYVIVDAKKNEIVGKYYGVGFMWNQNKNKLYYVETSPYFAAKKSSDKIVDADGNIYYVTEPGVSITDKISISDDEKTFAFIVNDSNSESRKLYIATLNKDQKLEKQSEIDAAIGDIEINDNKSIKIITPDGTTNDYNIPIQ